MPQHGQDRDPEILACFKKAILPATTSGDLVPIAPPTTIDRTKAFFFKQLKFFLTCLDTDVRRYASEWLFLLCNENGKLCSLLAFNPLYFLEGSPFNFISKSPPRRIK